MPSSKNVLSISDGGISVPESANITSKIFAVIPEILPLLLEVSTETVFNDGCCGEFINKSLSKKGNAHMFDRKKTDSTC